MGTDMRHDGGGGAAADAAGAAEEPVREYAGWAGKKEATGTTGTAGTTGTTRTTRTTGPAGVAGAEETAGTPGMAGTAGTVMTTVAQEEAAGDVPRPLDLPSLSLAELRTADHPVLRQVLADLRQRAEEPREMLWGFNNSF